jgi:hypothetical protein
MKVALIQLSAHSNTPEKTKRRLVTDDVADTRLLLAWLRVVQFTLLLSRRCVPVRSQEAFHFLDGQNRNEIGDVCPFFKLVCGVTQHPFNLGYRTRELFT